MEIEEANILTEENKDLDESGSEEECKIELTADTFSLKIDENP